MTKFQDAVDGVLLGLREGEVVTYGEVAAEAGQPRGARSVGGILSRAERQYPWWRVVNRDGRLAPGLEAEHARRLALEGVTVADGHVVGFKRRRGRARPVT